MFRECINTPIDPIPVEYVNTLSRLSGEPDYSLTCLGIALLKPRIENYSGIVGKYVDTTYESTCVDDFLSMPTNESCPALYYYKYSNQDKDKEKINEKLKNAGYEIKESIGALLKDKAETACTAVYHKEKNIAAIFINSKDIRFYHMLISFISLLFPALFKNNPLQGNDYEVIKALSKTSKDAFVKQIQSSVQPFVAEFRKLMLINLLKLMHTKKIDAARANVDRQRVVVKDSEESFANQIKRLKELIVIYEGMKATEQYEEPEEELVEYLSTNKQIHNLAINGSVISFSVATMLNNYNADAWATFAERGYIFDGKYTYENRHTFTLRDVFNDRRNRKIFLNSLFSEDPEFTIKIAGNYSLDLEGCTSGTRRNYDYANADPMYKSYMPNPHLKFFECLGGYKYKIADALRERNYIAAIELCIASAGSVDLDETEQTFRPFIGYIMSSNEKILRNKDGEDVTPEEALKYLLAKEKEE